MRIPLLRQSSSSLLLLMMSACGASAPATTGSGQGSASIPSPAVGTLVARLASASIGEDCAATNTVSSVPAGAAGKRAPARPPGDLADATMDYAMQPPVTCAASAMQLQLELTGAQPATVRILAVDVTDAVDAPIGTFAADHPQVYDVNAGSFVDWDAVLTPGAPINVGFHLSPVALPAGTSVGASSYGVSVMVEAVLPDGTVLRSGRTYLKDIAPDPAWVT